MNKCSELYQNIEIVCDNNSLVTWELDLTEDACNQLTTCCVRTSLTLTRSDYPTLNCDALLTLGATFKGFLHLNRPLVCIVADLGSFSRRLCKGGGTPRPLKGYHAPPAGGPGAKAPRTVAKFHFFKRCKVLENESSFQKYQHFSCQKNLFFLRKNSKN